MFRGIYIGCYVHGGGHRVVASCTAGVCRVHRKCMEGYRMVARYTEGVQRGTEWLLGAWRVTWSSCYVHKCTMEGGQRVCRMV